ncbi:GNAT family N-acetyltransferase [Vermiculatibacterium agrestimuris]|uniref:GNAT family N-acetyltransferase n=1 Tax=Vermiculatibacterium agrestimuris TaxID=2941519 RepID=UPI002041E2DF|nr:GNAT family N-acetyltransferase [Vermiculatibacterium agrestimuris]
MARIRVAGAEDMPALLKLYEALYAGLKEQGLPFDLDREGLEAMVKTMARSKLCFLAVAEEEGELVGFLCAGVARMDRKLSYQGSGVIGLIHDLYLIPSARGKGLASGLLDRAEAWMAQAGAPVAECQVVWGNELGAEFWARRGYAPVSVTRAKTLPGKEEGHVVSAN